MFILLKMALSSISFLKNLKRCAIHSLNVFIIIIIFIVLLRLHHVKKRSISIKDNTEYIYQLPAYNKTEFEVFEENSISKTLHSNVKILCLISTSRKELLNRAIHVNATWAQRCNKHLFLSHHKHIYLPYLELNVPETRIHFWEKVKALIKWVYEHELDNYDFFLRADDDAYFVMENLRFFLLPYDPDKAYIFGARFKPYSPGGYMSGGAGTVFSREAVRKFATALNNSKNCPETAEGIEDLQVGVCADKLNITKIDTRDYKGQHRMLPFSPKQHFLEKLPLDFVEYLYYPYRQDKVFSCCSEYLISFHYVYSETLYIFDFLLYKAKRISIVAKGPSIDLEEMRKLSTRISFKSNATKEPHF